MKGPFHRIFHPEVDGFRSSAPPAITVPAEAAKAVAPAISRLRGTFGGALELHSVATWAKALTLEDAAPGAGQVFAVLDYYHQPAWIAEDGAPEAFAERRFRDFWFDNGQALMECLAVLRRIPEEWLPRELMERQIESTLQLGGVATATTVRLRFQLPVSGGRPWLKQRLAGEESKLRTALEQGIPCPLVVFFDDRVDALIALSWRDHMVCYDPLRAGEEVIVDPSEASGFLVPVYSPAAPPARWWQRSLYGPLRAWRLARVSH